MRSPVPYSEFRTGLTFRDVYHMLYNRRWKRRRGVLGYWRELKLKMYAEYLREFEPDTADFEFGYNVGDSSCPTRTSSWEGLGRWRAG